MLAETITVTPTAASLAALIATAREIDALPGAFTKANKIKLSTSPDEDSKVYLKETGTDTPVAILDPVNGIYTAEVAAFDITAVFLSCVADKSVEVGVIVELSRI
jgi:hypothetical protein